MSPPLITKNVTVAGAPPNPESVFARVAHQPGAVWLDGGDGPRGWSILAWEPVQVARGGDWPAAGRRLTRWAPEGDVPFCGGCIGFLGFGAGYWVDHVPPDPDPTTPESWLARFDGGLCFRHADRSWHAAGTPAFVARAEALVHDAVPEPPPDALSGPRSARSMSRADFERRVRIIQELIAAGDCYQVNLTRAVHVAGTTDPWRAYRRLRARSAPELAAFLRIDASLAILSNSPELFLSVDGDEVSSLPVKGTRPRHADPARDAALADDLRHASKDRAELTMIVDLVRNDLGRVAVTGSVRTGGRAIVSHANVHHAQWRVSATLRPELDPWDALAATFPPGSVTGAPKVRACQRIAELEPEPRGVYCGAIGFVSDTGRARWSVAIRTAVWTPDDLRYHVGGGIVHQSNPTDEWWETVHKGTELARAFCGGPAATDDERLIP